MQVKKQQLKPNMEQWFKIGKVVCQDYNIVTLLICLYTEYIMRNTGLNESHAGIKIIIINISNFRYTDDPNLIAEIEEELKNLLLNVKKWE